MVTRFCVGSNKPTQRLYFHVSSVSPLPKTYRDAFHDSNWQNAMRDEYVALIKNSTWTLVPRPPDADVDSTHPDYVYLLQRSLYGLKQDSRAWFQRFASYITHARIHHSRCDTSLFIYRHGLDTAYLLLYVDDIVLTTSFSDLLQRIIRSLHQEFAMTDLDFEKAHMVSCNPSRTPVDTHSKLGVDGDLVSDLTLYRSLAVNASLSSAEAEYRGVANAIAETCWLRNLL
ncbi:ribonuclease H-like domain-containing protein, partial [Tanacetum coccineum]